VLVAVVAVHLAYPLATAVSLSLWNGSSGSSYASAALAALPIIFIVMALVVGPLAWRTWHGSRVAPWLLAGVMGVETWLYWQGSQTPSWADRSSSDRFAFAMFMLTALSTLAVIVATTANSAAAQRRA
jgi:hypothetical protein